jgi:hypothetical protein
VGLHSTGVIGSNLSGYPVGLQKGRIQLRLLAAKVGTEADKFRHGWYSDLNFLVLVSAVLAQGMDPLQDALPLACRRTDEPRSDCELRQLPEFFLFPFLFNSWGKIDRIVIGRQVVIPFIS